MADQLTSVVLASASAIRRQMLHNAGLSFTVDPADIDEGAALKDLARDRQPPPHLARGLAVLKATKVSRRQPQALVIGADQILELDGEILGKAPNERAARAVLMRLRGREHYLHSGVALARHGNEIWAHVASAKLRVRNFSDAWLDAYMASNAEALTKSVGAYQLEGQGVQLFERIEGDYFTILGLPLLELLAELRKQRAIGD